MDEKGFRYYRALHRSAVAINSSLDPEDVLKAIAERAALALGARACSIMLLSPDRRELRHAASHGLSDWYVRKGPIQVDLSMADALRGRSVAVLRAAEDARVQYRPQAAMEGIASMLSVPIRRRDQQIVGVMRIYTAEPREFSAEDVEFVEGVASLGAIALENARRYEEMKSDFDAVRLYVYGGT